MAEDRQDFGEIATEEASLTLGDRINYPYVLANQIITFQKAIVKQEGMQSAQEILEAAQGLYEMIPNAWRIGDPDFGKEVKEADQIVYLDKRKYWCGVPVGDPIFVAYIVTNPYKLFHACINLLQRRGMLARTLYTEVKTGKEYLDKVLEQDEGPLIETEEEESDDE